MSIEVYCYKDPDGAFAWHRVYLYGSSYKWAQDEWGKNNKQMMVTSIVSSDTPLSFIGVGIHLVWLYGKEARAYIWSFKREPLRGLIIFPNDKKDKEYAESKIGGKGIEYEVETYGLGI